MSDNPFPKLNPRQKIFADCLLAGMTQIESYRTAKYAEGKTNLLTGRAAWKVAKTPSVQQYIALIQDLTGVSIREAHDRAVGTDPQSINESVLTRVGILKRYEVIATECHNAHAHDTQLKALEAICKVMGFNKPEQLNVAQVHYMIDYGAAQIADRADGLPVLDAPEHRVALPIAPASEREREDKPPPFEPYFDPADVIDVEPVLVAATDSIALTADDL